MKGVAGYGRYDDDPNAVGCPRAKSDMTPCVARDLRTAAANDGTCVGCGQHPADLLTELVRLVTAPPPEEPPMAGTARRRHRRHRPQPASDRRGLREGARARRVDYLTVEEEEEA